MTDRVICYGDIIDDIVVAPQGPIRVDTDTHSVIRMCPGGSAANTAAWLGEIGRSVDLVGVVGAGDARRHQESLPAANAILREHPELPTGRIIVLVQGEQRDMLTDRGANIDLSPDDVTGAMLECARLLHLTGHVLQNAAGVEGVRKLIERCRSVGVQVSISAGSAGSIAEVGVQRARAAFAGADILFAGHKDGALLAGEFEPTEIARSLGAQFGTVVVTHGSQEITVAEGRIVGSFGVSAVPVVDPTGAGDAFCAGFLNSWLSGRDAAIAVKFGAVLGSAAVGALGGRPARLEASERF